jgi:cation-transporting P-type ATPase I
MLTGESQPVAKESAPTAARAVADRRSMLYEGTTVVAGDAAAVVVATGASTEAGRTARLVDAGSRTNGVEFRLRELSKRVLPGALGSGVLLLVTDLLRGQPPSSAVAPAVSLAVAAVPEGLPFIATVAELAAARRLAAHRVLVRNPATIEALGRVDVLCFDKTGTLTEGRISLRQVSDGQAMQRADALTPPGRAVVSAALRATPRARGMPLSNSTDRAIVAGAGRVGVQADEAARGWRRIDEIPFEPGRGYHAVQGQSAAGPRLSVKGSPEAVLVRCESWLPDGVQKPLDQEGQREIGRQIDELARRGYRVLAVAERATSDRGYLNDSRIKRLCFLGLIGLADPVRATAAESVAQLRRAGVQVLMITGDHPSTAESIAAELDARNGRRIMTGAELDELDDETLAKALPDVGVFARVTPAHKVRIVRTLRDCGHVVAVTGDGANDSPAIRMADVGVALGAQATAAARAAADVVVTDDRIETIIEAIVQGRAMWNSVRDSLSILLGGNLGEIIFILGSSLFTGRSALNARQILLVNLLTDMVPAMAVALRPPRAADPRELLAEGPEASLGAALSRDIYLRAGTTAAAATIAWFLGRVTGTRRHADTVALAALVGAQLLQTIAVSGRDRVVIVAGLGSLAALGLILSVPGLSHFFGGRPIGPSGWMMAAAGAGIATVVGSRIKNAMQH